MRGCSTFPPQGERDTHPQLSGRLADFSSVQGHATQPHRLAAYSLGVPKAMCKQAKEQRPESVHYKSGSLHGLPVNESPPLAGPRGGHFVLPAPLQRRQLCSFEEISEAAGTHGVSFGSMSSGLITHATTAAMAEISSPLDSIWAQLEWQHVLIRTDNTSVVSYINRQGGIRSRALCKQAAITAMGGLSPSLHQSNAHPRSSESRGGHAFEEENPSRGMEVTPRVG